MKQLHAMAVRDRAEVGRLLGITRQAVEQIENKAIKKLRQSWRLRGTLQEISS